jgi:integrase
MSDSPFDELSKEELLAIVRKLATSSTATSTEMTVGQIIDLFLAHCQGRADRNDFSHDALKNYVRELALFKAAYGSQAMKECRQHNLTAFLQAHPTWRSGWTQQRVSSTICCCFEWAKQEGLIEKNPYHRAKNLGDKKPRRPCEPWEYCRLMRNGTRAIRRILFFLRRTGCRTCEAREVTWDDVKLDGDSPHIKLDNHKTVKKTRTARAIGLDAGTANFLRNLRRQAPDGMANIFLNCEGRPWTRRALGLGVRRLAQRTGMDEGVQHRLSAYGLRHMFAVQAIECGMGTRQIADQLGHQTTNMIDKVYGAATRQRAAHLGKVANEATRSRLRERTKPLKKPDTKADDG